MLCNLFVKTSVIHIILAADLPGSTAAFKQNRRWPGNTNNRMVFKKFNGQKRNLSNRRNFCRIAVQEFKILSVNLISRCLKPEKCQCFFFERCRIKKRLFEIRYKFFVHYFTVVS